MYTTLISAATLDALLSTAPQDTVVIDCSFDLADPTAGRLAHHDAHIPGAYYLHLDNELSGEKTGRNGRHPLPNPEDFVARLRMLGIRNTTQVIAYDNSGSVFAARLWWMLRWVGHAAVAVLDGGKQAWVAAGYPLEPGVPGEPALPEHRGDLERRNSLVPLVDTTDVMDNLESGDRLVVDARSEDRFRGENETLDPVGGHIPGARSHFFKRNLAAGGTFKPASQLRAEWESTLDGLPAESSIMQCGSGVTACHNLLALEVAGLQGAALYPGSWSEWCADPERPVATGA